MMIIIIYYYYYYYHYHHHHHHHYYYYYSLAFSRVRDSRVREIEKAITRLYFRAPYTYSSSLLSDNPVPRVLSYPPYNASRAGRREPWERG